MWRRFHLQEIHHRLGRRRCLPLGYKSFGNVASQVQSFVVIRVMAMTDDGQPTLQRADYSVAIPGSVDGMVAERVSNYVVLRADGFGFTVKWDTKVRLIYHRPIITRRTLLLTEFFSRLTLSQL